MHFNVTEYVILLAKHKQAEVFIKKPKKKKNQKLNQKYCYISPFIQINDIMILLL